MNIIEKILSVYPELENSIKTMDETISFQNDGKGDYIKKWNYSKQIPSEMKLNKIWENKDDTV